MGMIRGAGAAAGGSAPWGNTNQTRSQQREGGGNATQRVAEMHHQRSSEGKILLS